MIEMERIFGDFCSLLNEDSVPFLEISVSFQTEVSVSVLEVSVSLQADILAKEGARGEQHANNVSFSQKKTLIRALIMPIS